jgi:hypothetical protein
VVVRVISIPPESGSYIIVRGGTISVVTQTGLIQSLCIVAIYPSLTYISSYVAFACLPSSESAAGKENKQQNPHRMHD